ncbi:hypothetical protein SLS62_000582 [Diatrype stigma]|uniref:ChrR-like cupin domain-containing protein n=1 Tax=Diatrype stigma TaxID=117547 RepID=A0AAN9V366_9PEZI
MEQFEFHPHAHHPVTGAARAWIDLEPGIQQLALNEDAASGRKTVLQRWQPRTANVQQQQSFAHDYVEEIFLVSGDLADTKRGGGPWTAGAYAYRKPGMEHGPFYSEGGCLMFIVIIPDGGSKGEVVKEEDGR